MDKQQTEEWLAANGWVKDRYGHYKKTLTKVVSRGTVEVRVKIGVRAARLEALEEGGWFLYRVNSYAFYSAMRITERGLKIGSAVIEKQLI